MAATSFSLGLWPLLAVQLTLVFASPGGAPSSACESMVPAGHVPAIGQTIESLYEIKLSSATYCPKQDVTITLMGKTNETIKGFLCQPRTAINKYETSGSMASGDSNMKMQNKCSDKAAITHTENSEKSSVVLKWTPNEGRTTPVFIVCTIVKEKSTFWVKQNVQINYGNNCTTEDMGTCSSDSDCSGMDGKTCVDGKCTSGAVKAFIASFVLILGCLVFTLI